MKLDDARRLQTGKVPGVTEAARSSFLALVVVSWKNGDSGNNEYGANRQQGRDTSHHRHVDISLPAVLEVYQPVIPGRNSPEALNPTVIGNWPKLLQKPPLDRRGKMIS